LLWTRWRQAWCRPKIFHSYLPHFILCSLHHQSSGGQKKEGTTRS
jgi:hypothetical protein